MTEDDALAWLKNLHDEVYDTTVHPYCGPAKRRLTEDELERFIGIVLAHGFPVTLHNLNTSIGMTVYEKPIEAPPGLAPEDVKPRPILALAAANLPLSEAKKMPDRCLWDDGWRVFSRLTHTDANAVLCKSCGLPEPKDPVHYAY